MNLKKSKAWLFTILYIPLIILSYSCSSKKIKQDELIGNWKLVKVEGVNNFEADYEIKNRSSFDAHYLVFSKDSFLSLEQPCFFLDKGSFSLEKDNLILDFGSWKQISTVSFQDTLLKLTRLENNSTNTYFYTKIKQYDTLNIYGDPAHGQWNNPGCFNETTWEFTGIKRVVSNGIENDSAFNPPKQFHIDNNCGWEKCILRLPPMVGGINLYACKYNGREMEFVPYTPFGTYNSITDTIYTYRLIKH